MSNDAETETDVGADEDGTGAAGASDDAVAKSFPVDDDAVSSSADAPDADDFSSDSETPGMGDVGNAVVLEHGFFRCFEEPYFRLTDLRGGQPVFVCKMGADEVILPFKGIMLECDITDDSPDGRMLMAISQALNFVKLLRPGDPLPPELFSDGVSWEVQPHHTALAHQRLSGQLLAWIFEGDAEISSAELLDRMMTDAGAKAKLNEAFGETAKQLGLGEGGREKVAEMIEELAADIAYIEALREKFHAIEQIQRYLMAAQKQYKTELSVFNFARSVTQLHFKATREFSKIFDEVDAQTGEIIAVLKNLGAQKRYIRKSRNKLHTRLMPWDEIIAHWQGVQIRNADAVMTLLRELYRFLAPRFMPVDEWVVQSSPSHRANNKDMRWDEDDDTAGSPVRAMDWF